MRKKAHLNAEGLQQIINLKASMNWGLSDIVKSNFINTIPVDRPIINIKNIPDPHWISGFICGEGNFDVDIHKAKSHKIGYQVQLKFKICQHERDIKLLELLIKYLCSSKITKASRFPVVYLTITKLEQINKVLIPLFNNYPMFGVKQLDFLDWCKVAKLMNEERHFTVEGLELIRTIKSKMNTGRKFY